jgi:RadC-like JAB domain-containing protein
LLFAALHMSPIGPLQHFAPPHDFGRKRRIAEVDGQPFIAEGDARDPKRTWQELQAGSPSPWIRDGDAQSSKWRSSREDIEMTREIKTAAEALGIAIHDHLVIGRKGHASFRSLGPLS